MDSNEWERMGELFERLFAVPIRQTSSQSEPDPEVRRVLEGLWERHRWRHRSRQALRVRGFAGLAAGATGFRAVF
jgi:hypothetical protein